MENAEKSGRMLHVLCAVIRTEGDVHAALRRMRHALAPGCDGITVLLFADFDTACAAHLPTDAPLVRALQSGVMAMNARRPGQFLLLFRARAWDDAQRAFLGEAQETSPQQVIAQLHACGQTDAHFDAATITPASLQGRFAAVLVSPASLCCAPQTAARMREALAASPQGYVAARVQQARLYPETALARLARCGPLSLSPLQAAREALLLRDGRAAADAPMMFTAGALAASRSSPASDAPLAAGCVFIRREAPTVRSLFSAHFLRALRRWEAAVPLSQFALIAACAVLGEPLLLAAALLPEALGVLHPRLLPGALMRLSLLPMTALTSLDALLCRALARSRLLRLRVPEGLAGPVFGALCGGALLAASVGSVHALVALLPVSLFWLSAPLLLPALDSPTMARIPLGEDELAHIRSLAESTFFADAPSGAQNAPLRMLTACAGGLLGLLEADEAARRIDTLRGETFRAPTAWEQAALLSCAQYLREQMDRCDAALRALPAQLEAAVRAQPLPQGGGMLDAWIACARSGDSQDRRIPGEGAAEPLDALFLPLRPAKAMAQHARTLPLTHPHTFLRRELLAAAPKEAADFLALSAAALGHPFHALLLRSPVTAPYAAILFA